MDAEAVAQRYRRFAREEAPGRSEVYGRWAQRVADDTSTAAVIAGIRPQRRQPPLVFAVARMLGLRDDADAGAFAVWVRRNAAELVAQCERRSLQTNEPLRCAALLPALSLIDGPLALLEVGASAGLCLYPDRYSYRFTRDDGSTLALDPTAGPSPVVLDCRVRGPRTPPLSLPEVVWRAGIDLNPLDARVPDTAAWLTALVWPGEEGRVERIRAALRIAASDPPVLVRGDAADLLAEVAATAPREATVVVTTPGVLVHVPRTSRQRVIADASRAGRWLTLDPARLHPEWSASLTDDGFGLALDGDLLAATDPLGAWWEWRAAQTPRSA